MNELGQIPGYTINLNVIQHTCTSSNHTCARGHDYDYLVVLTQCLVMIYMYIKRTVMMPLTLDLILNDLTYI